MEPWYKKSFGSKYSKLYAHRNQLEAEENITSIVKYLNLSPVGPVLDLCCGGGRHLLTLKKLGFENLYGLDLSEDLLTEAKDRLSNDESITLIKGDMRKIPYDSYFKIVFSLFTSFGYFSDDIENYSVLKGIYDSLEHDGVFVMDYLNKYYVCNTLISEDEKRVEGMVVANKRWLVNDGERVEKKTVVKDYDGNELEFFESVRMFSRDEMVQMLNKAGFSNIKTYGYFDGSEFTETSPRLIIYAEKK